MKELKFRVWDKCLKLIREVDYIDFSGKEVMYWLDADEPTDVVRDFKDVEIMQYTGLKDINGKEIYEGDILKPCFVVYWLKGSYFAVDDEFGQGIFLSEEDIENNRFEVAGNIYENPELAEYLK